MIILNAFTHPNRFLWVIFLYLLCLFPSLSKASVETLSEDHPVYRQVQAIYERLVPAFGDGRLPPKLMVVPKGVKMREPVASSAGGNEGTLAFEANAGLLIEGYIAIEERAVKVLAELGKDRDNALAFLLAHELSHFYLRHGWVGDFGNAFARTDMGRKMMKAATYEDVLKREAEADYFGGFYGYLAGYDTLGAAPRALERIYAAFGLADQLPNYPSKAERIAIAQRQQENLKKLIPVYEAGTRLLVLGRYEEAGRLFSHLAQIFPSREMFNNAGVSYALEAVRLLPPGAVPFVYPFELDGETRLRSGERVGTRGIGSKGADEHATRRLRLLRRALEAFERAALRDSRYTTAKVNSAAVQSLLGDQDEAIRLAGSALTLAREEGARLSAAHALIVRGIALARAGESKRARTELEAARAVVPELAVSNIAALEPGDAVPAVVEAVNDPGGKKETIAGISPWDQFKTDPTVLSFSLKPAEKGQPDIGIHSRRTAEWDFTIIVLDNKLIGTVATMHNFRKASARGITIGTPLTEVRRRYGNSGRIVPSRQGAFHVYAKAGIVFDIDTDGKIEGWFLYAPN